MIDLRDREDAAHLEALSVQLNEQLRYSFGFGERPPEMPRGIVQLFKAAHDANVHERAAYDRLFPKA